MGRGKEKEKIKVKRREKRGCQLNSGTSMKKKATREQNENKKAAAVQSAALLCSFSVQLSAVTASDVLNSVNHTLISSWLRWSMSASSSLLVITRF